MDGQTTLFSVYCDRFKCPPGEFEKKVFWQCLHPPAAPVAFLIWFIYRDFFKPDLTLIDNVKTARSYTEVRDLIAFASMQHRPRNFLRLFLNIRMSKRRLQNLARDVFSETQG